MRRFYSEKIQILSFFKLYDSIVSLPAIILIAGIILLFVYIFVGYRVIIDKRKSDISWRVKNKEKNAISYIRLCLLMDMNFNSGITLAYYVIYLIMFYCISVIYIYNQVLYFIMSFIRTGYCSHIIYIWSNWISIHSCSISAQYSLYGLEPSDTYSIFLIFCLIIY